MRQSSHFRNCRKLTLKHNRQSEFLRSLVQLEDRNAFDPVIQTVLPPVAGSKRRSVSSRNGLRIFHRDNWTCRYTGEKLIFRGYLKCLSILAPSSFPYHKNGRRDVAEDGTIYSHQVYWSHQPSIDHIVPVAQGGDNSPENLITTAAATNTGLGVGFASKVGLVLTDPIANDWNGCVDEFLTLLERFPELLMDAYVAKCHKEIIATGVAGWTIADWDK